MDICFRDDKVKHIKVRSKDLCIVCMPTFLSFQNLSEKEIAQIQEQKVDCRVCNIIKEKFNSFPFK